MTSAKIQLGSVTPWGSKIRTFVLTYPRFIHSELMTHRVFSRNAASSRAIPIKKMIESLAQTPMDLFERFGKNQSGMQAKEEQLTEGEIEIFCDNYKDMLTQCVDSVEWVYESTNAAKQILNRFLEPFMHMTTIVTVTNLNNFFFLRCHKDAQPEFQSLAYKMLEAELSYDFHSNEIGCDQWHTPFASDKDGDELTTGLSLVDRRIVSVARCAAVSYVKHEAPKDLDSCRSVFERMRSSGHWSPFEHQATPMGPQLKNNFSGNLMGWYQFRKEFVNEDRERSLTQDDLKELLANKPKWIK